MRQRDRALACIGAVIGAGFASGREIVVFFTRYGASSWALIVLTVAAMTALCAFVMLRLRGSGKTQWCALYEEQRRWVRLAGQGCLFLLFSLIGGAMLSAGGELLALLLPFRHAYGLGCGATLLFAALLSQRGLKPLSWLSLVLTALLIGAYVLLLRLDAPPDTVVVREERSLVRGAIGAVAYAGMNLAIGLGVVCECADGSRRTLCRSSVLFGATMLLLLFLGNALYLRDPGAWQDALPIIPLLAGYGRTGFLLGAITLYLAMLTSLLAVVRALNDQVKRLPPAPRVALPLLAPLGFSLLGFQGIVETWYAPIGLCCIALLFLPMLARRRQNVRT